MRDRLRLALYFARYLRPRWGLVVLVLVSTVLVALARLPISFLPKVLTENFSDPPRVMLYFGLVLAAIVVGSGINVLRHYWSTCLGEMMIRMLRRDVLANLERLSMLVVYSKGPGQFVQQTGRDTYAVREVFSEVLGQYWLEVAIGICFLVPMFLLEPSLSVGVTVVLVATPWIVRWINRRVEMHARRARELSQESMGQLVEYVGGFRDLLAAGQFRRTTVRFDELLEATQRVNIRTSMWSMLAGLAPSLIVSFTLITVYYFGYRGVRDVSELGQVITYVALVSQLFPALMAVTQFTTLLATNAPSMAALKEMLEQPPVADSPAAQPLRPPLGSIRFEHVTIELEGRRILDDVSFEIPHGQLTAVVGESGAGKTTLFYGLLRLIEPSAGTILIHDRPIADFTLDSLRAQIGFIPQNPFIFNQSLRENILLASAEPVSAEQLATVLERSQLTEVVARRQQEGGLESVAGYLGNRLSGGEKQRIALARLILRDPQIIVCDEYTANVDVKTARLIHESMRTHFASRTRMVITHELANARGADWIVVLERGRVVQQGRHEELCGRPGLYRELLEVQRI